MCAICALWQPVLASEARRREKAERKAGAGKHGMGRLLEETSLVCGRADLEDGLEGLCEEGADALEVG